jgi:hypothetical protein
LSGFFCGASDLTELILCLFALILGPLLYQLSSAKEKTYAFFDGFVLAAVGGLVLFEILPRSISALGVTAILFAIFGFLVPHFLEHRLDSLPVSPRTILSGLIIAGLVIHQLLDGAALHGPDVSGAQHVLSALGIAIILHQVPKGFLLWELARKASGLAAAALVIGGLLLATMTGFLLGAPLVGLLEQGPILYFQAFIAGGLLHVVVHHVSFGAGEKPQGSWAFWGGVGALAALLLFIWMPEAPFIEPVSPGASDFRTAFLNLSLESAFPILLGLLASGLLQAFYSSKPMEWFRGRNRFMESMRGIIFGIPLPVCSCGVTPIYHTLVRRGVSSAAAIAFLIATPEIGVDSFFLSFRMLGTEITLIRLGMAFLVALLTSTILAPLYRKVLPDPAPEMEPIEAFGSEKGLGAKLKTTARYGFVELVDQIGAWLVAGIVIAALLEPYLDPRWFSGLPPGLDILILSLAGLPIYVCASGATPLAAVLLSKGVSAGAVLAFLITGPTTNITTFGVLSRLHGTGRALALPMTVFAISVVLGFSVNSITGTLQPDAVKELMAHPHGPLELVCTSIMGILLALSLLRLGPRRFLGKLAGESSLGQPASSGHKHSHDTDPCCDVVQEPASG